MDLLDRLLGHDSWTTRQLLDICARLDDRQLDQDFDIGHRTLRATLDHIIHNVEAWSAIMADQTYERSSDRTIPGMMRRLSVGAARLRTVATRIAERSAWDEKWIDHLESPPEERSFGTAIAHVITHSMHHRAQLLYMLRLCGVANLPEGDVFSWENRCEGERGDD